MAVPVQAEFIIGDGKAVETVTCAEELATDVRTVASDHYDQPVRVRLLTKIEIGLAPVEQKATDREEHK